MSDSKQTEKKVNANIDHFSAEAQQEVTRLRKEIDDLRVRARPKVQEAENFLSSPQVTGFIGGKLAMILLSTRNTPSSITRHGLFTNRFRRCNCHPSRLCQV